MRAYKETFKEMAVLFTRADPDKICERPICAGMSAPLDITRVLEGVSPMSYVEMVDGFELPGSQFDSLKELQTRQNLKSAKTFDTAYFDKEDVPLYGDLQNLPPFALNPAKCAGGAGGAAGGKVEFSFKFHSFLIPRKDTALKYDRTFCTDPMAWNKRMPFMDVILHFVCRAAEKIPESVNLS